MSTNAHTIVQLGELVTGVFDCAAQCHSDPRSVRFLAARAVEYNLRRAGKEAASNELDVG